MRDRAAILLLLVLGVSPLWADDPPALVVRPFTLPTSAGGDSLAQGIRDSLGNQLKQNGFALVDGSEAHPARFAASAVMARESGSLVLQLQVTDLSTLSVVASDIISVIEGLTALDPINASIAGVAKRAHDYWVKIQETPLPVPPMQDSVVFHSKDEGAEVFWQGHQSIGTIKDGQLVAPYYPFPSDAVLVITVEKKGWRTKTTAVQLNPANTEYNLPSLEKLRVEELHVFNQLGRLIGLGVEYRNYFLADWAFWSVEAYPFAQWRPDNSTSKPVWHLDVAGSAATWLYFSADSWFRLGIQSSVWLSTTAKWGDTSNNVYFDTMIVPFGLLVEWNVFGLLIDNRVQIPFSLGLSTGVAPQRWLFVDGTIPLISIGVVQKW